MGCCVSKKRSEPPGAAGEAERRKVVEARDLAPPEEEKVKEVLSETPRVKPRRVAGAVVAPSAEKGIAKEGGARVKDVGGGNMVGRRAARPARSVEEKSEAASESSAATTATGPERSPSKPPRYTYRQGVTSGAEPRRARRDRDRAAAVPGGHGRASPSPPPPRRDPGRRSPSPAAKRSQDQRGDSAASSCAQRKPAVPARPGGRAPTPRRAQDAPCQQPSLATTQSRPHEPTQGASPPVPVQEDAPPGSDVTDGAGDGEGKESLENPLVSMECFIFL